MRAPSEPEKGTAIPFMNIPAQLAPIRADIEAAIARVLDTCQFTLGDEVAAFETEFAAYCNTDYAMGVNTGTSALHLALLAAGVGPGDEVITVPHTFVATVAAVCYTGARPVLVDVDPATLNIDVRGIEEKITAKTKVILPVHLYGQPADMDPILEIARNHHLVVIEDAAQAHGAEYKGKRAGSIGDMGCFSFYPGKNLGACGEGGMVTTNNREYAEKIRMLRDWGMKERYHHDLRGYNFRMEGIQGAVLRVKLRHLDKWTDARRDCAALYDGLLAAAAIPRPARLNDIRHAHHLYVIRVAERDRVRRELLEQGIQTNIHYPIPVHLQKGYADLGYRQGNFPHAEQAAREVLSLPFFPELTPEQIQSVVHHLQHIVATRSSR